MTQHTPGPWFTGNTPSYLMQGQQVDGAARQVQPITIRSPHHAEEIATVWNYLLPTEGNANLIAAAPDLLAALQECLWIMNVNSATAPGETRWGDAVFAGRAAIAKAKGGLA